MILVGNILVVVGTISIMIIYFNTRFKTETKLVKQFLKNEQYTLTSKRIKNPSSIIVDNITKEYKYDTCTYFGNVYVFWLFKSLTINE